MSLLGIFGFAWVVAEALDPRDAAGLGLARRAVLLLSGVQLLDPGPIGEYIGRLYLTLNRKPQAVVREIVRSGEPARAAGAIVTSRTA